jgi:aspartyl-tRNA synthetase
MESKTEYRTHSCGELRKEDKGSTVTISGWVNKIREHGNLVFIDIRDRYGVTQVTAEKSMAENVKKEYVLQVTGKVEVKPEPNKALATGDIEIKADKVNILNSAKTLPIDLDGNTEMTEDTRLKYRYLDLRRKEMQDNLVLRHKVVKATRDFFDSEGFLELETPVLGKSTPEGARDYLVPSRINKGGFYALPQSPQIFKQLFMISGYDKYMQIVRCFRDEDLRKDRQPEFTQIDLEMSYVGQEDVLAVNERFIKYLMKEVMDVDVKLPLPRLTYDEAMEKYGSDKPDLRFGLKFKDITELANDTDFNVFKEAEMVKCLAVDHEFSRKEIDKFTDLVKIYKAKGLAWVKVTDAGLEGGISKFLGEGFKDKLDAKVGQTIFFIADKKAVVYDALGALRLSIA